MSDPQFHRLVQEGILREATPGTYYLFEREKMRGVGWVRIGVLWLVLFVVPLLLIYLLE